MKTQKYHFFALKTGPTGRSLLSLPGQTLSGQPLTPGILVKDARGSNAVSKARKSAADGEVFFTTTLRRSGHSLTAKDMHSLERNDNVLLSDAHEEYEKTINATN